MRSIALRALVLAVVCALSGLALRAQTAGHIRGTVVDDDGKALEGVQVEASASSASRATKTGKDGQFRFFMIPPGSYKVFLPREVQRGGEKRDGATRRHRHHQRETLPAGCLQR